MLRSKEQQMHLPSQLALNFHGSKSEKSSSFEMPIDQSFPEEEANKLAALESYNKHLYRPNTYLHKWWARRSGTTFRYILKQLVRNPHKRNFYEGGGLEGKVILDPMMGGGTTLHEAIRMGANAIGLDIDPIPVLQARASLTQSHLHHKEQVFEQFLNELKSKLSPFYLTKCPICGRMSELQFLLYGLRRRCTCREVIFVDSLLLRKGNDHDIHICPLCQDVFTGKAHACLRQATATLIQKGTRNCDKCNNKFADILDEPFSERYVPLVVVGTCIKHNAFFKSIDTNDLTLLSEARAQANNLDLGDPKSFFIHEGPKSKDLIRRGVSDFRDLFGPRQLLYLKTSMDLLMGLAHEDRLWLALLISTSLEFNSLLCGYKGSDIRRPGAIRHVFSHHAYSFPYTALENNPVFSGNTSGTMNRLFHDRIVRAGKWAVEPIETIIVDDRRIKMGIRGEIDAGEPVADWKSLKEGQRKFFILQGDTASVDFPKEIADFVVTDPPYYDNVQYSDLSNFFRVWLRQFLPFDADWNYDHVGSAVSKGSTSDGCKYGEVLSEIWKNCFRALNKKHGRLIFTFHHWKPEAWAELSLSLKNAGFLLINRYIVFSENPISVHIMGLNSLKHDTILVLKPKSTKEDPPKWPKISQINTTDSYTFCHGCGSALGWFLESNIDQKHTHREWKRLIGGNDSGKTSF
jgi:putative DNA methylase